MSQPIFFDGPGDFRDWLEANHEREAEVFVGFYKKATGKQTMSWSQAVDQALCFGWIDGKVNRIDDERHRQRFTPRKSGSTWSKVNVAKVEGLTRQGLMRPAGIRAFAQRTENKTGIYSYEQRPAELPEEQARQLRAHTKAAEFFSAQPPWYRKAATWWVISAKREETRARRLATLIEDSEHGRTLKQLTRLGAT